MGEASPEKAGVGGSTPSLATISRNGLATRSEISACAQGPGWGPLDSDLKRILRRERTRGALWMLQPICKI
jgi:hypothetical protein